MAGGGGKTPVRVTRRSTRTVSSDQSATAQNVTSIALPPRGAQASNAQSAEEPREGPSRVVVQPTNRGRADTPVRKPTKSKPIKIDNHTTQSTSYAAAVKAVGQSNETTVGDNRANETTVGDNRANDNGTSRNVVPALAVQSQASSSVPIDRAATQKLPTPMLSSGCESSDGEHAPGRAINIKVQADVHRQSRTGTIPKLTQRPTKTSQPTGMVRINYASSIASDAESSHRSDRQLSKLKQRNQELFGANDDDDVIMTHQSESRRNRNIQFRSPHRDQLHEASAMDVDESPEVIKANRTCGVMLELIQKVHTKVTAAGFEEETIAVSVSHSYSLSHTQL